MFSETPSPCHQDYWLKEIQIYNALRCIWNNFGVTVDLD